MHLSNIILKHYDHEINTAFMSSYGICVKFDQNQICITIKTNYNAIFPEKIKLNASISMHFIKQHKLGKGTTLLQQHVRIVMQKGPLG